MIKVLLAEDHTIVRNGIRSLLDKQTDIQVVAEATNGLEVLKKLKEGIQADLVLTDINMTQLNGIALIEEVKKISPGTKVLILSMLDQDSYIIQAVNSGVNGYLLKNISEDEMMFAIRHVIAGNLYICSELIEKLLPKFLSIDLQAAKTESKNAVNLSRRELEILLLIAEGFTNNEIAEKLFTSRRTVEGHRLNLLEKTCTKNTATLIRFAVINGLIN
ncbi:MAG: response regulator transcription factor [Sphingobacteriaceae bacterium]|nr:response regulator transcription factor [Sphingobacteriaceae bacterium]